MLELELNQTQHSVSDSDCQCRLVSVSVSINDSDMVLSALPCKLAGIPSAARQPWVGDTGLPTSPGRLQSFQG